MGEKIRDIKPIKIGNSSLMIELNEGYTPADGRLIHIQNKKYRYLLKEMDFYHLCSIVMRSWSEFDYIKKKNVVQRSVEEFSDREPIGEETTLCLNKIAGEFEKKSFDYRALDLQNNLISICIKEETIPEFERIIKSFGGKKEMHPYSETYGYTFLYLMTPFLMYKVGSIYIEVFCQLPCASLTPKNWIPLDRMVQKRLWSYEEKVDNVIWVEPISRYIFHLCWAVFHNNAFSKYEREYLSKNKLVLEDPNMRQCLLMIFFNFTDSIIEFLKKEEFDSIIPNYFHFKEY